VKDNNPVERPEEVLNMTDTDDPSLRPKLLDDYVGQTDAKKQVEILVKSAKKRSAVIDHVLIHGFQGLGKTTLAQIIANEMGTKITISSGQAITKVGDMAALLSNLQEGEILFIDEIHRLKPAVEEMLYTAMEDFVIDIVLGKGPTAKSMRLDVPRFALVGATTKLNSISSPLRDRFGCNLKLSFYTESDIAKILKKNAEKLEIKITNCAADKMAECSRRTPRIANNLLRRVRDMAVVKDIHQIDESLVLQTLTALGINEMGLNSTDLSILKLLNSNFEGGPVGLGTIAAALNEDRETLEYVHEPFLIQLGLMQRTHRGRLLTSKGIECASQISV
jgi:Holliday junction DNA helicase RuvB